MDRSNPMDPKELAKSLALFEMYAEWLDDKFDDDLDIKYECFDFPVYKIVYDPTVDRDELIRAIPRKWKEREQQGLIQIQLVCFTEDSDEYKESKYITDVILKDKKEEILAKLKALR